MSGQQVEGTYLELADEVEAHLDALLDRLLRLQVVAELFKEVLRQTGLLLLRANSKDRENQHELRPHCLSVRG